MNTRLAKKQEEIDRCQTLLRSLYENLADGVIDREEYQELKKAYTRRKAEAEEQAEGIRVEMSQAMDNSEKGRAWMEQFRKHQNITALDRTLVVSLIERIMVYRDKRVEIVYRWQNEFRWQVELLQQSGEVLLPEGGGLRMARTKRKVNPLRPQPTTTPQAKEFQTAAYIRLSIEDSGKPGSDTIEGQKDLLLAYIERQADLRLVEVYCDNGRTGTNFNRPDFERMMEDVRRGRINCIVVKDLSRFGRNYHETSNYLLRIFPFLGVRFVAVNDYFDTETAVETERGLVMPLKNIINDTYSRDISRKISSAIETKERRGEFIGVYAPYGYSKSDDDRHKLVPNPETAPIIREIFALRLQGLGYTGIARLLNGRGVPSPGVYLYQCGLSKQEKYRDAIWAAWNIKEILRDEVYLGHLVQGKRTNVAYKQARKERNAPADEWRIFRNAHEP